MEKTILTAVLALAGAGSCIGADEFAETFRHPPRSAKPHTWYHVMNGNVAKEGITQACRI